MAGYDVIVVGTGGVGSAAMYHLAARGARVLGIDRFPPAHDRGSSHGETRIYRHAYFEHPDYVPLMHRAYALWNALDSQTEPTLMCETGLLEVGDPKGEVIRGIRESARHHNLPIESLDGDEVARRFPAFRVPDGLAVVFEPRAGYLRVERCVEAHLAAAQTAGATLKHGVSVNRWTADRTGVNVETDHGTFSAARLVLAPGPWAPQLLKMPTVRLTVRRKLQFWYTASDAPRADAGFPCFLFALPEGVFYGFPPIDALGIKVAEHSGGHRVLDPTQVDRSMDDTGRQRCENFLHGFVTASKLRLSRHSVCMYTMSADEHFLVGVHPDEPHVVVAAGLSGHGFKFASVLGEILADLAMTGATTHPIGLLAPDRASLRSPVPPF